MKHVWIIWDKANNIPLLFHYKTRSEAVAHKRVCEKLTSDIYNDGGRYEIRKYVWEKKK